MDITTQVTAAINGWLAALAAQLLAPALSAVSDLLFRTPSFAAIPAVAHAWAVMQGVVNALFVLAWLAAGLLVMTQGGIDVRYAAKLLVPRVALAAILANASLAMCGALVALNNAIVDAVLAPSPAATVGGAFGSLLSHGAPATDLVAVIVATAAAVLALLLIAVSVGRIFALLLATAIAPIALATYALPQTDELARTWWRVFAALLFVQVLEAVLVRIASELAGSADWLGGPVPALVSGLAVVTLLYALLRLPFAAYAWAFHAPFARSGVARVVTLSARAVRRAV